MYCPAARCAWVQVMNRSNPSTVVGGGEMNRVTSSAVSSDSSDGASDSRSSRSVTFSPASTGRPERQSLLVISARDGLVTATSIPGW